jgi:hypothetical protein
MKEDVKNRLPRIMIAAPIHNRGWILGEYLKHLKNLNYPKDLISFYFILNNCVDNSRNILRRFKRKNRSKYASIRIDEINYDRKFQEDDRSALVRKSETYKILAELRNIILSQALASDGEMLFSVDSDILTFPNTLNLLLHHDLDAVAALVGNGGEGIYNFLNYNEITKQYDRNLSENPTGLIKVDLTGAAILLSRKACEAGRGKYIAGDSGEDQSFCEALRDAGISMYVDGSIRTRHIMNRNNKNGG